MRAEISVCLPEFTAKRLDDPAKTSHLTKAAPIIHGMAFILRRSPIASSLICPTSSLLRSWIF